ncbi:hypothetical protein [Halogeometricum limi]|uniref:hypothetical protein n=1 Tax=Halogeometricum limi TaxID=555875 RepID=UPI000B7E2BD2|nr:hypothetical protein [Halogeometricum limi]
MSTNTRPSTEPPQTTDDRPAPTSGTADAADATTTAPPDATTHSTTSDPTTRSHPAFTESWVDRCQRQFESGRTDRLHNLADEENHAMSGGV